MNSEFLHLMFRSAFAIAAVSGILIGFIGFRHFLRRIEDDFGNGSSTRDQQLSLPRLNIKRRA